MTFLGSKWLPGRKIELEDAEGSKRTIAMNGFLLFLLVLGLVFVLQALDWFSLSTLVTHFIALFITSNVLAFGLAIGLHLSGSRVGGSQKLFSEFFLGRQLNPKWLGVDLKIFSYRPSLIALALLNLSFGVLQYETYGYLTLEMVLYQAFTLIYVLNYFQFETGMVHTWDIVSERFGWMLVWGNFVLVPFFYSIAGWWLVHAESTLSVVQVILLCFLFLLGFWMFRGSNQQKHAFKQNPDTRIWGRPASSLDGRLLVSGFWGVGRHLNYTGEICVYTAFLLTVGSESWIPYLLLVWLVSLLVHRAGRDEKRCRAKYGELWERYKRQARFSMVPYIY